ncbi:hypothetical protein C922_01633 [Plasmodium inui San Antonio 1]|uniref:Regulator of chromosome condensation n=1 Tax=Plasmodium inui San Antonio 1 TaxID=1237626 RepID=W7ARG4_9APIC|nr:hypothetical protein C922_01633 [Plasmodium inui San Antonio 1]EUD68021.1 hypothetical protein C922_01633 [Plasmodium inui San Antonio 1]
MSGYKRGSKIHVFVINDVKNEEGEKEELDHAYNADGETLKGGNPTGDIGIEGDKPKVMNSKKNKKKEIIRHKMYHPQVKIVKVSCGKSIIGFLSVVGKIYCWQLNDFDDFDKNVPYLLVDSVLKNKIIHDVSSGDSHIAFISKEGELFTYGDNTYGQLGNGNDASFECEDELESIRECTPDSTSGTVPSFSTLEKDVGGPRNHEEVDTRTKKKQHKLNKVNKVKKVHKVDVQNNIVKCVYSRDRYTLYLTIDGFLYGFGLINEHFIQGEKNKAKKKRILTKPYLIDTNNIAFKKIAIGNDFILGISFNNSLYSWGDNTNGVLGYDDCTECHEPKLVDSIKNVTYVSAGKVSLCKTGEDDLYIWGGIYGCKPSMVKNKFSQMIINRNFIIGLCAKKNIWVKKIDTLSHGYYINNLKIDLLCSYDNLIIGVENHLEGELEPVHTDAKVAIQSGSIREGKHQVENIPLGEDDLVHFAEAERVDAPKDSAEHVDEARKGVQVIDDEYDGLAYVSGGNVTSGDTPPQQEKESEQGVSPNDQSVRTVPTAGKGPPSDVRKDVAQNGDEQISNEDSPPNKYLTGEQEKSNGIPQVGPKSGFAKMNQLEYEGMTKSDSPKVDSKNGSNCMETKSDSWDWKENITRETEPAENTYHKVIDTETKEDDYFDEDYYDEEDHYDDEEEHFLATNFYGKPEIPNLSEIPGGLDTKRILKGKEKLNLKSALKKFPSSERLKKSVSFSNYVYDLARSNYELMSGVSSSEEMETMNETSARNTTIVDGTNQRGEPPLSTLPIFHYDSPRDKETNGSEPVSVDVEAKKEGTSHHPDEDILVNGLEDMPHENPSEDKLNSQFIWDDPPQEECMSQEASLNEDWNNNIAGQTKEEGCSPLNATADGIRGRVRMYVDNPDKEGALKGDTKYVSPLINDPDDKVGSVQNSPTKSVDTRCTNWGATIHEEQSYNIAGNKAGFTFERTKPFPSEDYDMEWGLSQRGSPIAASFKERKKDDKEKREVNMEINCTQKGGFKQTEEYHIVDGNSNESYQHIDDEPSKGEIVISEEKKCESGFDWNENSAILSGVMRKNHQRRKTNQQGRKTNQSCAKWKDLQKTNKLKIKYHIYKKRKCRIREEKVDVPNEMPSVGTELTLLHPPQVERQKMTKLKRTPIQLKEAKEGNDQVDLPLVEGNPVITTNVTVPSDICQCCGGLSTTHTVNLQVVKKEDSTHKRGDSQRISLEDGCTKNTSILVDKEASNRDNNACVKEKNTKKTLNNDNAKNLKTHKTGKKQVLSKNKDKPVCSKMGSASKRGVQSGALGTITFGENDQNGSNTNGIIVGCSALKCRNGRKIGAATMRRNSSASNIYNDVCEGASEESEQKCSKLKRNNYFSDTEKRTTSFDDAYSSNTSHLRPIRILSKIESYTSHYDNSIGEISEKKLNVNLECMKETGEGAKNTEYPFQLGLNHPVVHLENDFLSRGTMDNCAGKKSLHRSDHSLKRDTCWGQHFPPNRSVSEGDASPSFDGSVDSKLCRKIQGIGKDTSRCYSEGEKVTRTCSEVVKKRSNKQERDNQKRDKQKRNKQKSDKLPGEKTTQPSGESQLARLECTIDQHLCSYDGEKNPPQTNSQMVRHDEAAHPRVEAVGAARSSPKKKLKRKNNEGTLCLYSRSGSNDTKVAVPKKGNQNESVETYPILSKQSLSKCKGRIRARSGSKDSGEGGKMNQTAKQSEIVLVGEEGKKKQKKIASSTKRISSECNDGSGRDILKKLGKQIRRMKNDIALDRDYSGKVDRVKCREQKDDGGSTAEIELIDEEESPQRNKKCERLYQKVRRKLRDDPVDGEKPHLGNEKKRMKKLLKDVKYIYEEYKCIKKEKEENEKKKNYLKKVLENTVMKTNQVIRLNKSSFQVYIDKMRKENLFLKNELDEESHQHHYDLQQLVNKITHLEQVKDLIARQNEEFTKRNSILTIECEKYKKREVEMSKAFDSYKKNLEKEKKKKKYILRKIEHSLRNWETDYNELKHKYNSVKAQNGELLKRSDELAERNDDLVQKNELLREEARALRRELQSRKHLMGGKSAQQVGALGAKGTPSKRDTTSTATTNNNSTLGDLPTGSSTRSSAKRTHGRHPLSVEAGEETKSSETEAKQELHLEEGNTSNGEALSTQLAFLKDRLKQKWNPSKKDDSLMDPFLEGIIQMAVNLLGEQNERRGSGKSRGSGSHLSSVHSNDEDPNGAANFVNTARSDKTANTNNTGTRRGGTPEDGNLKMLVMEQMEETMRFPERIKQNCAQNNEGEATTQQLQEHHLLSNETTESKTDTYETLSSETHVDFEESFSLQTITREGNFDTTRENSTKGGVRKWVNHKVNYTPSENLTELKHTTDNGIHPDVANETTEKVNNLNGTNGANAASGILHWGDNDGEGSQMGDQHIVKALLERKKKKKKKLHSGKDNYNDEETHKTNEHPLDERILKTKIRGLNEKSLTKGMGVNGSSLQSNEVITRALSKKNTQLKEIQKNDFSLLHDTNNINKNNTSDEVPTANDALTERRKVTHAGDGKIAEPALTDGTHKKNGPGDNSKGKKKELNAMLDCIFDTSSDHSSISANMVDIQSLIESNLKNIFSAQD